MDDFIKKLITAPGWQGKCLLFIGFYWIFKKWILLDFKMPITSMQQLEHERPEVSRAGPAREAALLNFPSLLPLNSLLLYFCGRKKWIPCQQLWLPFFRKHFWMNSLVASAQGGGGTLFLKECRNEEAMKTDLAVLPLQGEKGFFFQLTDGFLDLTSCRMPALTGKVSQGKSRRLSLSTVLLATDHNARNGCVQSNESPTINTAHLYMGAHLHVSDNIILLVEIALVTQIWETIVYGNPDVQSCWIAL